MNVQTQRLLITLASSDTGLSLSGIRNLIHQDNGKISPYLKLMTDSRLIRRDGKSPRGSIYSIRDSLFKLWIQTQLS